MMGDLTLRLLNAEAAYIKEIATLKGRIRELESELRRCKLVLNDYVDNEYQEERLERSLSRSTAFPASQAAPTQKSEK